MSKSTVIFAGAGPGAPDLITLRCMNAIKEADMILYAGSLVNPEVLEHAKNKCEIKSSADMNLEETTEFLKRGTEKGLKVLRLHTGDPSVYGAIAEQMNELDKLGISYEVIPGVSSVFASAAALKAELTLPGISQTLILTRRAGRTPVPEKQDIKSLASHQATMALFLSVSDIDELVEDLLEGGYSKNTAVGVVYRASWKNQKIVKGTLEDIAGKIKESGINRQAMIIVGDALKKSGDYSLLYDASFAHGYRGAVEAQEQIEKKEETLFNGRAAVYALTEKASKIASQIKERLEDAELFVPVKFSSNGFEQGGFEPLVKKNWPEFDAHIFVMATGIVVRKIAPLMKNKTVDPAVVVCDEAGKFSISLLSGHIGGANRLSKDIASILGGDAVITTATDVQGLKAFDELSAVNGWKIENPGNIKILNSMLLEGKKIAVCIPENIYKTEYADKPNITHVSAPENIEADALVILNSKKLELDIPVLYLKEK